MLIFSLAAITSANGRLTFDHIPVLVKNSIPWIIEFDFKQENVEYVIIFPFYQFFETYDLLLARKLRPCVDRLRHFRWMRR